MSALTVTASLTDSRGVTVATTITCPDGFCPGSDPLGVALEASIATVGSIDQEVPF